MHKPHTKIISFIGRSLLWSALLYICAIIVLDWKDLRSNFSGDDEATVVRVHDNNRSSGYNISADTLGRRILTLPKSLLQRAVSHIINDVIITH